MQLMDELLSRAASILVLGCGGGNLATRLKQLGKNLTIVDNNPISFVIAQKFFALPDDLACIVSDFRKFIFQDNALYDGIAIDIGGPGFRFNDEFDAETCESIRARLAPRGSAAAICRYGSSTSRASRTAMRSSPACRNGS
jgi:spermidine synthase